MADAVWPAELPQEPLLAGLSENPPYPTVRTKMSVGPDKVRNRAAADVTTFPMAISLTRDQVAILDDFYRVTTLFGANAFEWKHPRTGNPIDYRFTGPPSFTPKAPRQNGTVDRWGASFELEAMPGTEQGSSPPPIDPPPEVEAEPFDFFAIEGGGGVALNDFLPPDDPDTPAVVADDQPYIFGFGDEFASPVGLPIFSSDDTSGAPNSVVGAEASVVSNDTI